MPQDLRDVEFEENYEFGDVSNLTFTKDGYLVAEPRIARSCIQIYKGSEMGHPELETIRVYRPEDSVFDKKSMATMAYRTITLDHPPEMVNSSNWKKYSVGISGGDVARDGDCIRVPLTVMDGDAIKAIRAGKAELSVGYISDISWESGKTPSGEVFDAVQKNIRANHIAIVAQARGGPKLRLGDNIGDDDMPDNRVTATILVDGINVTMDEQTAAIVSRAMSRSAESLKTANDDLTAARKTITDLQTEVTTHKRASETKDGEIAVLKKQVEDSKLRPEDLDKRVSERQTLIDQAVKVLGKDYKAQGKTDVQIKRDAVEKDIGAESMKALSDMAIDGAFVAIVAKAGSGNGNGGGFQNFSRAVNQPSNDAARSEAKKAYDEQGVRLSKQWQTLGQQTQQ